MTRQKKLSPEQKAAKRKRREEYMNVFINGKQKRIKRPPTIDGMDMDEFIRRNAELDNAKDNWKTCFSGRDNSKRAS